MMTDDGQCIVATGRSQQSTRIILFFDTQRSHCHRRYPVFGADKSSWHRYRGNRSEMT